MHNRTITELKEDLIKKNISSVELTKHFIERIKKFDPILNFYFF